VDINGVVKLADFGMAKHVSSKLTYNFYQVTITHNYPVINTPGFGLSKTHIKFVIISFKLTIVCSSISWQQ
jgi:hypothetical protein